MFNPTYIDISDELTEIKSSVFRSLSSRDSYNLDHTWIDNAIILLRDYPYMLNAKEYSMILYNYSRRSDRKGCYKQTDFLNAWQNTAEVSYFGHQALANSLAAFGELGIKPSDHFLLGWYRRAEKIIGKPVMQDDMFTSQELVNILKAFERLALEGLKVLPFSYFLGKWFWCAEQIINSFNAQALAHSLRAFGKLRIPPYPMFLLAWYKRAIEVIGEFNSFGLTQIISAFAVLDIQPDSVFFALWRQRVIRIIDTFEPKELVNCLQALGRLRVQLEWTFLSKWYDQAKKIIDNFNELDLVDSLMAFKELGVQPDSAFFKAWSCRAKAIIGHFSVTNLQESIDVCRSFNLSAHFLENVLARKVSKLRSWNISEEKYNYADAEELDKEATKMALTTQSFYAGNQVSAQRAGIALQSISRR